MSQGMQPGMTPEPVDPAMIDAQFQQLEAEASQLEASIEKFGHKLQAAAMNGDYGAKAWLSELRLIAMQVRAEQNQMHTLLQAMHGFTANALHQLDMAQAAASAGGGQAPGGSPPPGQAPPAEQYAPAPQAAPGQAPPMAASSIPASSFPGQPQPQAYGQQPYGQPYGQPPQPQGPGAQGSMMAYDQPMSSPYPGGGVPDDQQHGKHHSMFAGLGAAGGGALAGIAGMFGMRRAAQSSAPSRGMQAPMGTRGAMFGMRGPQASMGMGGRMGGGMGGMGGGMDPMDDGSGMGGMGGGGMVQGGNAHRFMSGRMGGMMKMGAIWGVQEEIIRHL